MTYAQKAIRSLLYEAVLNPKPGLVDAANPGAHKDMDVFTFIDSALALQETFESYYALGRHHDSDAPTLFNSIREIGIQGEKAMFDATLGVNTHKGANFSFGVVLSAMGACHAKECYDLNCLRDYIKTMTHGLVKRELEDLKEFKTHGELMFENYGITGIRGEAELGFPLIFDYALPFYLENNHLAHQERLIRTLLILMRYNDDSNLLKRGGKAGLIYAQEQAKRLQESPFLMKELPILNESFIDLNLSPGGSADLLALTHFLAEYAKKDAS